MARFDKNTTAIVLAAMTALGGGVELRVSVARLETKVDSLSRDVAELQRELPRVARVTLNDDGLDAGVE